MSHSITTVNLDQALLHLLTEARAHPKHKAWVRWGDVEIDLIIRQDWTSLRVWRQGAAPDETEWNRIMDAWPYAVDCLVAPSLLRQEDGYCVETAWPSPLVDQVEF